MTARVCRKGNPGSLGNGPREEDPQWDSRGSEGRVIQKGAFYRFLLTGCRGP